MQQNEVLNQVLVVMGRSLLQYSADAWPWTGSHSSASRAAVEELIADQKTRVARLAELLDARGWTIDFGVYPDFTGLHYLSLEFVLPHLVENQRGVVTEIETALPKCTADPEGTALLIEILAAERAVLSKLEELSRSKPPAPAQSAA
jgi:hypothetical protein